MTMTQLFFGTRYDAPIYEHATETDTPTGRPCYSCAEPIEAGDDGWVRAYLHGDGRHTMEPIHRECDLLGVIGHNVGICPCHPEWANTPRRQQALECVRRWDEQSQRVAGIRQMASDGYLPDDLAEALIAGIYAGHIPTDRDETRYAIGYRDGTATALDPLGTGDDGQITEPRNPYEHGYHDGWANARKKQNTSDE